MADFLFAPTPHNQAIDFLKSKPALAREVFDQLLPELRAYAFTVAGVTSADALQTIRNTVAELPTGTPWNEVKARLVKDRSPWVVDKTADEETQAKQETAATRKAELLLRLHGGQAYSIASYEVQQRQRRAFPYLQYRTMEDSKVRPGHAALDGVVLPADDPFWDDHYPPWDYGCRCLVIPLSRDDYDDMQAADVQRPVDEKQLLDSQTLARLNDENRLARNGRDFDVSTPVEQGKSYAYRFQPSEGLQPDLGRLKARYDEATWQQFETFARTTAIDEASGRTVWDWLTAGSGR